MEIKKLKDLCIGKGEYGIAAPAEPFSESKYRYLRITDISDNGTLLSDDPKSVSCPGCEKCILQENDIVFARTGNSTGRAFFYEPKYGELVYAGFLIKFHLDDTKVTPKYMKYYTISQTYRNWVNNGPTGSTRGNMSEGDFADMPVFLPSRKQQDAIVNLFSPFDEKIDNNNAIAAELEGMAKDLYDYWFVRFDFPDENGKPYKSSGGKMVWNEELKREIPEGWEYGNLYSIAEPINGLACQKYRPKNDEESLPVVKIKEMHTGITTDTERVSSNIPEKNKIFDGDILFSWSATLEVMFWFGGNAGLNQHIFKIVPINGYTKEYVYYQYSAYVINFVKMAEARKTTMGHITTDHLEQSRIILPPINVVQAFSKITAPIYEKIGTYKQECNDLTSLRDFLLPMLMNGQVKVKGA